MSIHDVTEVPLDERGAPDLQLFIRACGSRYARAVGEQYDWKRHGGYRHVSPDDWRAWDAAIERWQVEKRAARSAQ
jgi:hypothetical protein